MPKYRRKPQTVEAVEVSKVLAGPEGDWSGLPGWLKLASDAGAITFDADGVIFTSGHRVALGDYIALEDTGAIVGISESDIRAYYDIIGTAS